MQGQAENTAELKVVHGGELGEALVSEGVHDGDRPGGLDGPSGDGVAKLKVLGLQRLSSDVAGRRNGEGFLSLLAQNDKAALCSREGDGGVDDTFKQPCGVVVPCQLSINRQQLIDIFCDQFHLFT